ncbi:endonuclease domain-containing protein [Ottowia sp.]|uniref:endonuclease domain-containing protein n=1 Tax=Ottowia sp. TaxID=1898956 RepID=UPI002C36EDDD|nr:endonuclease domain-containing protein [Ottowia sp.]HOB67317.1 endonuclease domain-containing protein [Ottowia sp.]HPZ55957.1 endonuclease domain-containing protein [Ottowia sp.]HQD48126.1 endonuclease domain-containing protein [Ottowia sp.]
MALPFNPALKARAKALRKAGNLAEVLLWNQLKNGQFKGLDFDRQKIIGNYIVDFYCAEKGAVIEVDGGSHDDKAEYDAQRDAFLGGIGLRVIRILDKDVKHNMAAVIRFLMQQLLETPGAVQA